MPYQSTEPANKLSAILEKKLGTIRKQLWDSREEWEEYEFQLTAERTWLRFLESKGCHKTHSHSLPHLVNEMDHVMCAKDPNETGWIIIPRELAERMLLLGELP
jgi:hypothetical protein